MDVVEKIILGGTKGDSLERSLLCSSGGALVDTITITCNYLTPLAYLHICLVDDLSNGVLSAGDDATIPKCCHQKQEVPSDTPTVCYSLEISCVSLCIEQQEQRLLRGSKN